MEARGEPKLGARSRAVHRHRHAAGRKSVPAARSLNSTKPITRHVAVPILWLRAWLRMGRPVSRAPVRRLANPRFGPHLVQPTCSNVVDEAAHA